MLWNGENRLQQNDYKTVLFIDPQQFFPIATNLFDNVDYYAPYVQPEKMKQMQGFAPFNVASETEKKFNIKVLTKEEDLKSQYDLVVLFWCISSLGNWLDARLNCMVPTTQSFKTDMSHRREFIDSVYSTINKVNPKKVVIFDPNDSPGTSKGLKWLDDSGHRVDHVFKREFRRTFLYDYDKRVNPFPYMGGSGPHPWFLFENRVKGNQGVNGCFWSGAPIYRFQVERPDEWCNRNDFLAEVQNHLVIKSGLSQEVFLNQFNTYKIFLHLNGTGHLCGRFFEGLSRDSLMMMQEMDVVFPFENGEGLHPLCVVLEPREFVENLNRLMNDEHLYAECKSIQESVIQKYYSYDWIRKYIFDTIDGVQRGPFNFDSGRRKI